MFHEVKTKMPDRALPRRRDCRGADNDREVKTKMPDRALPHEKDIGWSEYADD
jgi:hypothetical protein